MSCSAKLCSMAAGCTGTPTGRLAAMQKQNRNCQLGLVDQHYLHGALQAYNYRRTILPVPQCVMHGVVARQDMLAQRLLGSTIDLIQTYTGSNFDCGSQHAPYTLPHP